LPPDDQDQDGEIINLKLAMHRNGPTGEIQLWFKKKQTPFVSYAGERYAEAGWGRRDGPGAGCSRNDRIRRPIAAASSPYAARCSVGSP